jgi:hypothetical protein
MADSVAPSGGAGKVDSTHSSTDRARMMPPTRLMKMLAVPRQSLSTAATAMALKMPPT